MPVLEYNGRLWRAFERRDPPVAWGINYRAGILSAPVDADLLDASNRDVAKHGFQYVDWLFDGPDIIAACRTAYDDGQGGAHNAHDANYLTFHRISSFRARTMADSVPMPERVEVHR